VDCWIIEFQRYLTELDVSFPIEDPDEYETHLWNWIAAEYEDEHPVELGIINGTQMFTWISAKSDLF